MDEKEIRGVIVPILTPLKPDETVDVPSLRRLVNYVLDNGVHGIWASATNGEFAALPDRERLIAIETVVDEVSGRVPIICNVSGPSTQISVDFAMAVQETAVDGIAATPPYYYPHAQDELLEHYRYIRDRLGRPLWVYNIPPTVKTAVAPGTIAKLASEGTVVGVKDSSGAGELLAELNVLCDQGDISLLRFLGTVYRVASSRGVGVHGAIPGIANLVPAAAARAWEAGEVGNADLVRRSNAELITANKIQRLAKGGSANAAIYAGMKSALKMMGILDHDTLTRPMRSMTEDEKEQIPPILKELGLLN